MPVRHLSASALAVVLSLACNTGEFSGGSQKKLGSVQPASNANDPNGLDSTANDAGDGGGGLGNSAPDGGGDGDGEDAGGLDSGGDTSKSKTGSDQSIADLLGGLFQVSNDAIVTQVSDNELDFGGGKVFRLGDDNASASSCLKGISAYPVTGKKYYFEFEVKKSQTTVEISLGVVCGVDYSDTNFVSISSGGVTLGQPANLSPGISSFAASKQTLGVGKYQFVVESKNGSKDPSALDPSDYDDYIVGNVRIKADKPIKAGTVGSSL